MNVIIFCLGTAVASFANCHAVRYQLEISNRGHSFCDNCHTQLNWWQLIPIMGYLFQKGKCFQCHAFISPIYPTIELFTGIIFTYLFTSLPIFIAIKQMLLFSWVLILALEDFYTKTVSLKLLIPGEILIGMIELVLGPHFLTINQLIISLTITLYLSILSLKKYFGWADTLLLSLFSIILSPVQFAEMTLIASLGSFFMFKICKQLTLPFIPWIMIGLCFTWFHSIQYCFYK